MSSSRLTGADDLEAERDYWRTLIEVTNAHVGERAPVRMLALADAIAQLEVSVSRHLGRRRPVISPAS